MRPEPGEESVPPGNQIVAETVLAGAFVIIAVVIAIAAAARQGSVERGAHLAGGQASNVR